MDLAQKTLIDIASLSQRLGNTLDRHVGHKTIESVELDDLVVGSRTALEAFNRMVLLRDGYADDRLTDWLKSGEPQECLHTLKRMEKILKGKVEWSRRSLFNAPWSTQTQDQVGEAIKLFKKQEGYFHFLLNSDIWNRECVVQQSPPSTTQPDVSRVDPAIDNNGTRQPPPLIVPPDVDPAISKNGAQRPPPLAVPLDVSHVDPASNENGTQQPPPSTALPGVFHVDPASVAQVREARAMEKNKDPPGVAQARGVHVTEKVKRLNLEKLDGILKWLNAWKSREIQERTIILRQADTCTWFLKMNKYKMWKSAKKSFLWLHGKPGAGKSVLAASVIEDLENSLQNDEVVAYFYCNFREERSTNSTEVLRSLLSQLLKQFRHHAVDPGDLFDKLAEEREGGASTMNNVMLLAGHISRAAEQFHSPPFLVIDALDECTDVEELLVALGKLRNGRTRLFTISRPLQIIKDGLSGLASIDMEKMREEVSADIRLHVRREVDSHRRLRVVDAKLKHEVCSSLCKKAGGMFRWVQCQLNTLKRCVTMMDFREALNNLPGDLDETYGRILLAIDLTRRRGVIARHALDWLVVALRPFKLSEIMEGLSVDMNQRALDRNSVPVHGTALLDVLGSLVMYDEATDIVILSHFSVKEFLIAESTRKRYPAYYVNEQAAHTQLALLCLCYIGITLGHCQKSSSYELSARDTHNLRASRSGTSIVASHSGIRPEVSHPLLRYVLSIGFSHLEYVNPKNKAILHAIKGFQLTVEQHSLEWDQLCIRERSDSLYSIHISLANCTSGHDLSLYILTAFASELLLCSFIGRTKLQPKDGTNPLIYAAHFDKLEHARMLLSRGVDVNRRGLNVGNPRQVLPLQIAVQQRNCDMVDLFLDEGSHVPHILFEDALWKGRQKAQGPSPARIASRLSQTDEFVEWASSIQEKSVFLKRSEVSSDVVAQRRVLQIGCDPSAMFREPFARRAVSTGNTPVVKHILLHNISFPPNIILDASRSKNPTMIRLFLDLGYKVDVTTLELDTPIHLLPISRRHPDNDYLECLRVLVDAGCNPSAYNSAGDTTLHLAAWSRQVPVIDYFLSLRIPLPPDILFAARGTAMVLSLIRRGADVHAISANGDTPLHDALRRIDSRELVERAKMLVGAGWDPRLSNALGETALDVAVQYARLDVVQYLLSIGVPPPPRVLLHAIACNSRKAMIMVRLLIDSGADVRVTCPNGDTLLHLTISARCLEFECLQRLEVLVATGCDPCARNSAGETPFHIATRKGLISVMAYLLSLGIPLPADIMLMQFGWGRYGVAHFLLDRGADPHTISKEGDTLLHTAAGFWSEQDALRLVQRLVDAGCDPLLVNSKFETSLHIAVRNGHISIITYLFSLGIPFPPDVLLSASTGYSEMIRYLIKGGADVSVGTADGDTPLHLSVTYENETERLECVKILVDAGCDPRARNTAGNTPLHVAAKHGYISVVHYFLSLGLSIPLDILLATPVNSPEVIRYLVGEGADVNAATVDGDTLLHLSMAHGSEAGCLECVKTLVDAGCDPRTRNTAGETPLHAAAKRGYISVVRYLLSLGLSIPPDILLATSVNFPEVTRYLIGEGADVHVVTVDGDTQLHLSITHGDEAGCLKFVKILVDAGCDPRTCNTAGETPLHAAAKRGFIAILRYFLAQGVPLPDDILRVSAPRTIHFLSESGADMRCSAANVDMQLLHRALGCDSDKACLKCAQTLIGAGWDASSRNSVGETSIHIAARHQHISALKYLLSQSVPLPPDILLAFEWNSKHADGTILFVYFLIRLGAGLNVTKSNGDTPLHLALRELTGKDYDTGWWSIVEALLEFGANPFTRNTEGKAPVDIAKETGQYFKANFLRLVSNSQDQIRSSS